MFFDNEIMGLVDEPRSGRPSVDDNVLENVNQDSHQTAHSLSALVGASKDTLVQSS